jgi:hypothetical protein
MTGHRGEDQSVRLAGHWLPLPQYSWNRANTGDNIEFTKAVLAEAGVKVSSVLLVSKPYEERPSYAMMWRLWPEVEVVRASTPMGLEEYADSIRMCPTPSRPPLSDYGSKGSRADSYRRMSLRVRRAPVARTKPQVRV